MSGACRKPVGEENKGWNYAKFLLGHERTSIARVGALEDAGALLKDLAAKERGRGRAVIDDDGFASD